MVVVVVFAAAYRAQVLMTDVTSPRGEIRRDADGRPTLVFRCLYPNPIEDVWSAMTDSETAGAMVRYPI